MSLLPIFLKLDGRPGLLVGAGTVALDKIGSLLKTGIRLRVVAPAARPEIRQLAAEGKLEWISARLNPPISTATSSSSPQPTTLKSMPPSIAKPLERGILCNSVDDIPNCDFFFGSVVSRGDLQIAISTAGESPAFAQRLRREIDEQLPGDLGPWLAKPRPTSPRSSRHTSTRRSAQAPAPRTGPPPDLRLPHLLHAPTRPRSSRRIRPRGSKK